MKIMVRRVNQSLFPIGDESRAAVSKLADTCEIELHPDRSRTKKQNSAIHVFFTNIANACNDSGQEMEITSPMLKNSVTVQWTDKSVKEYVWRPVQKAMFPDTHSTKDLSTKELSQVAAQLQHFLANNFGLSVDFPSQQSLGGAK